MNANGYLEQLANASVLRHNEKESIARSVLALFAKLKAHFGVDIKEPKIFGSYSRGTILPRSMDAQSDVDCLIEFSENNAKPQTYLNRLRRFVTKNYSRSEIAQSNPTIVINLNHIRFELVPAVNSCWSGLEIPARTSDWNDWQEISPWDFQENLIKKNKRTDGYIRKLIRLLKYWNACNGRPFQSYDLEERIVEKNYWQWNTIWGPEWNLFRYFYDFASSLSEISIFASPAALANAIDHLQSTVEEANQANRSGDDRHAINCLNRILPSPT
jgi:predicted nucleotidyltransferase